MAVLITLAIAHSNFLHPVVWYVADKEAEKMRKILKDFYYGNITPSEGALTANSNLRREMVNLDRRESQLTEQFNEAERALLA